MKHIYNILPLILFSGLLQAATPIPPTNELQPSTPPPQRSERPQGKMGGKPPVDAIKMCLGKAEKTACSMNGPQGEEKGFCEHTPDQLYFACNPQRGPAGSPPAQPPARMPPQNKSGQSKQTVSGNSQVTLFPIDRDASYLKSQ